MSNRYGQGSWQDRRERLMEAYFALEDNPLWRDLLEDCQIHARDLEMQAGTVSTDRDANRLHGAAAGVRSLINRAMELRDARMAYFAEEEAKEKIEYEQSADSTQFGESFDRGPGAATGKIERRRLFAEVEKPEVDA